METSLRPQPFVHRFLKMQSKPGERVPVNARSRVLALVAGITA
jgi:hypothetical protein